MSASGGNTDTYDVIVLGGGTAGTAAARAVHEAGGRALVFNDGELGGLCILRGCMPTKTLLHAAHSAHEAAHGKTPGVSTELVGVDFKRVMTNKDAKVERFKRAKVAGIESGGYELIDARAVFTGPNTVEAKGRTYTFTRGAVIATGSVPRPAPIAGIEDVPYLTSDEVMELAELPDSLIVVGSGAIGLELAQFFARIGSRVQLVSRRRMLAHVDEELADEIERAFGAEPNLELFQPCPPRALRRSETGVVLELEGGRELTARALVLATGRSALVAGLGLEAAGVAHERDRIVAGPDMRTTNPRIFVAGDASGERLLLHVANWEGTVAGSNAFHLDGRREVERRLHMAVVFSDPALALLGQSEAEARAAGRAVVSASLPWAETGRAITMEVQHGLCKLVAGAETGEILGAQILGPRGDDLIHTLGAIMYYRGTARDMLAMPWYHPTLSEVLLSLARSIEEQRSV